MFANGCRSVPHREIFAIQLQSRCLTRQLRRNCETARRGSIILSKKRVACIFAREDSTACLALFEWLQTFHRQLLRRRADNAKRSLLASEGNSLLSSSGRLHQMALRRSETVSIFACTGSAACLALFEWLQAFHRQLLRRRADNAKRSLLASEGNSSF